MSAPAYTPGPPLAWAVMYEDAKLGPQASVHEAAHAACAHANGRIMAGSVVGPCDVVPLYAVDVTLLAELVAALRDLAFAAMARDNTQGDPVRLVEVRAELEAKASAARALLARIEGSQS